MKKPTKNKKPTKITSESKPNLLQKYKNWLNRLTKPQKIAYYIFVFLVCFYSLHLVLEASFPRVKNPNFGVSFSVKYAKELGVDWQDNFNALLDDLKIRNYRLMSYWDESEAEQGKFNFTDLDWQMNEAAKRNAKVSLALGLRQPRWPECHRPSWYDSLSKKDQDQALYKYLTVVVQRYKNHPALISYQLENEAVNTWFGTCTDKDMDRERLRKEADLVKSLDPDHPLWMSLSDQHGLPLGTPVPDKYGYSVYRTVYNDKTGPFKFYLTYPTPVWYHRARALWIKLFKHRDIFIHELQLEPWAPVATVNATLEEQDKSMNLRQMQRNINFACRIGKPDIYTWGGEWWYWRKVTHQDETIWEKARELLKPRTSC